MFGINIDNVTLNEACDIIINKAKNKETYDYVVTPNVDHIVKLQHDPLLREIYRNASLILADGMPLIWASKLLGYPLKEKVSGSDIFPQICRIAAQEGLTTFFLGGMPGVAEKAKNVLVKRYPKLSVVGLYSPPFGFEKNEQENKKVIDMIKEASPDILFVGLGCPKQEKWIYKNLQEIKVPISLGTGAAFDFVAGTVKRAPKWMQKSGLEWFWRFSQEPRRLFKRYFIDDMQFIKIVYKEWQIKKNHGVR